jgi:signal transduction histidine kinase
LNKSSTVIRSGGNLLLGVILLISLYLTSLHSYLLFHSLIELFTIIVAAGIFVIAWNARAYMNNNYLLFLGIASVFVAFLDALHTLAYQGMGVFRGDTANLATQLWIAARYLQSLSWLVAPLLLGRRLRLRLQIGSYVLITGLLVLSIFYWHNFPAAFVAGAGLTAFKKISEYVISLFLMGSIAFLWQKRQEFDAGVARLIVLSLGLTIASEVAFTSYVSVFGEANLIGHFLRLIAWYVLYKAIIETGLLKPYAILLRDLKSSHDQLRAFADTLQARNEDLIRSENRLREDAATLKARNEELDAFAHTVAHNLKNPLCVIIAAGDVINGVSDLTRKEQREFLQQIKSTAFEMDNIIDNLLLLAEVRKVDAPSEPVDMKRVVNSVRNRLQYLVKEYHGRLIYPEVWPAVIGYGPWIEEVWANYISNALKYGGASPCVELGATLQPGGMIRFWTRDNGLGIPCETQAGLFTPFTQLRNSRKGGHGLGLSIVLRIVEKLGGQVGVESELGKGSLFYFTLSADTNTMEQPVADGLRESQLA